MRRKLSLLVLGICLVLSNQMEVKAEQVAITNVNFISSNGGKSHILEEAIPQDTLPIEDRGTSQNEESITEKESVLEETTESMQEERIILTLDQKDALVNGVPYTLNAPPIAIEGRTYLPLRFIGEQVLHAQLDWQPENETITISKDGKQIIVVVGKNIALVNGEEIELDAPPIVKEGSTLLPVRFISEQFNIISSYDKVTKEITLVGPSKGTNTKPIASFNFSESTYVAGQVVSATSTSYDSDGHKLIDKLWCIVGEKTITNKELSNMFRTPRAGTYTIGLQVQDEYGLWSDWTYQDITILPNQAPTITYLGTEKKEYAQGEELVFQYLYENEEWETITNQKWTYRKEGEDRSKAILGKPEALFTGGTYIIGLELDDAYGNRSQIVESNIHITDEVLKQELTFRFTEGNIGDIIDNYQGFNYREYQDVKLSSKTTVAGTMIMSDSPEVVMREGILYRDSIQGTGRILIHHINSFSDTSTLDGNKRFVMVAENKSNEVATITLTNKTIKGPVDDILLLGQKVLNEYLAGSAPETMTLMPGEKKYIYDSKTKWVKGSCIAGLMDVETTGQVMFTMAAVSQGSTLDTMDGMELLLKQVHPRGTFDTIAFNYNIILDGSIPEKMLIGIGQEEWIKGYDAITNEVTYSTGNFGMSYYITITAKEDTGIILNPRADMFRGAIEWQGVGVYNIPKIGNIYSNTAKAVSLGTINAGETKTIEYMLPNGSSAPVLLGFIPKSYWNN